MIEIDDPRLGKVRQLGALVKMSATPADTSKPAPGLNRDDAQLRRGAGSRALRNRASAPPSGQEGRPPLEGVTVIELGTFYAGPYGATVLTELGARVIKLELIDGDPMRWITGFPEVGGVKVLAGKESVALDVQKPEGREIALELVRRADMVLRSFRAGVPSASASTQIPCSRSTPTSSTSTPPGSVSTDLTASAPRTLQPSGQAPAWLDGISARAWSKTATSVPSR